MWYTKKASDLTTCLSLERSKVGSIASSTSKKFTHPIGRSCNWWGQKIWEGDSQATTKPNVRKSQHHSCPSEHEANGILLLSSLQKFDRRWKEA